MTEQKKYHYVYLTTNLVNGKQYVGDHDCDQFEDIYLGSGKILLKAIKKYKRNNFKQEILEYSETKKEAFKLQEKYIKEYNTLVPNGYNISPKGGLGLTGCHSIETKKLISESRKGKPTTSGPRLDLIGEKNGMYNKSVYNRWVELYGTQEADKLMQKYSKKLSESIKGKTKGRKCSKETLQKLSENNGSHRQEVRKKISDSLKGNIPWNKGIKNVIV